MQAKIQKWGNSLAIRIPKGMAQETGLYNEAAVELQVRDGYLIVERLRPQRYSLDQLLEDVSAENLHAEVDIGPARGGEIW